MDDLVLQPPSVPQKQKRPCLKIDISSWFSFSPETTPLGNRQLTANLCSPIQEPLNIERWHASRLVLAF